MYIITGTERFWSYLNKFVALSRRMKKSNRRQTLFEAARYFIISKNLRMGKLIINEMHKYYSILIIVFMTLKANT